MGLKKLIILDRDGVINQDSLEYIKSPEEFILLPGSCEAIARLNAAGFLVAVVTNQSGIARGLYNEAQLEAIHDKMRAAMAAVGGRIDLVLHCPHMPNAGCNCRKPKPGMLYEVAKQLGCPLEGVPLFGDRVSDVEVALTVGASPRIVLSPMGDRPDFLRYPDVPVFASLAEGVEQLLNS